MPMPEYFHVFFHGLISLSKPCFSRLESWKVDGDPMASHSHVLVDHPPPRIPAGNEGFGWDFILKWNVGDDCIVDGGGRSNYTLFSAGSMIQI